MIKNLRGVLKVFLRDNADTLTKPKKNKLLIYDEYLNKYVSADELLIPQTKISTTPNKSKKSKNFFLFEVLLRKFVNPKLDLLITLPKHDNPILRGYDYQTKQSLSTLGSKLFWKKKKSAKKHGLPALPPVHDKINGERTEPSKFGWAGQLTKKPLTDPRPEKSQTSSCPGQGKGPKQKKPDKNKKLMVCNKKKGKLTETDYQDKSDAALLSKERFPIDDTLPIPLDEKKQQPETPKLENAEFMRTETSKKTNVESTDEDKITTKKNMEKNIIEKEFELVKKKDPPCKKKLMTNTVKAFDKTSELDKIERFSNEKDSTSRYLNKPTKAYVQKKCTKQTVRRDSKSSDRKKSSQMKSNSSKENVKGFFGKAPTQIRAETEEKSIDKYLNSKQPEKPCFKQLNLKKKDSSASSKVENLQKKIKERKNLNLNLQCNFMARPKTSSNYTNSKEVRESKLLPSNVNKRPKTSQLTNLSIEKCSENKPACQSKHTSNKTQLNFMARPKSNSLSKSYSKEDTFVNNENKVKRHITSADLCKSSANYKDSKRDNDCSINCNEDKNKIQNKDLSEQCSKAEQNVCKNKNYNPLESIRQRQCSDELKTACSQSLSEKVPKKEKIICKTLVYDPTESTINNKCSDSQTINVANLEHKETKKMLQNSNVESNDKEKLQSFTQKKSRGTTENDLKKCGSLLGFKVKEQTETKQDANKHDIVCSSGSINRQKCAKSTEKSKNQIKKKTIKKSLSSTECSRAEQLAVKLKHNKSEPCLNKNSLTNKYDKKSSKKRSKSKTSSVKVNLKTLEQEARCGKNYQNKDGRQSIKPKTSINCLAKNKGFEDKEISKSKTCSEDVTPKNIANEVKCENSHTDRDDKNKCDPKHIKKGSKSKTCPATVNTKALEQEAKCENNNKTKSNKLKLKSKTSKNCLQNKELENKKQPERSKSKESSKSKKSTSSEKKSQEKKKKHLKSKNGLGGQENSSKKENNGNSNKDVTTFKISSTNNEKLNLKNDDFKSKPCKTSKENKSLSVELSKNVQENDCKGPKTVNSQKSKRSFKHALICRKPSSPMKKLKKKKKTNIKTSSSKESFKKSANKNKQCPEPKSEKYKLSSSQNQNGNSRKGKMCSQQPLNKRINESPIKNSKNIQAKSFSQLKTVGSKEKNQLVLYLKNCLLNNNIEKNSKQISDKLVVDGFLEKPNNFEFLNGSEMYYKNMTNKSSISASKEKLPGASIQNNSKIDTKLKVLHNKVETAQCISKDMSSNSFNVNQSDQKTECLLLKDIKTKVNATKLGVKNFKDIKTEINATKLGVKSFGFLKKINPDSNHSTKSFGGNIKGIDSIVRESDCNTPITTCSINKDPLSLVSSSCPTKNKTLGGTILKKYLNEEELDKGDKKNISKSLQKDQSKTCDPPIFKERNCTIKNNSNRKCLESYNNNQEVKRTTGRDKIMDSSSKYFNNKTKNKNSIYQNIDATSVPTNTTTTSETNITSIKPTNVLNVPYEVGCHFIKGLENKFKNTTESDFKNTYKNYRNQLQDPLLKMEIKSSQEVNKIISVDEVKNNQSIAEKINKEGKKPKRPILKVYASGNYNPKYHKSTEVSKARLPMIQNKLHNEEDSGQGNYSKLGKNTSKPKLKMSSKSITDLENKSSTSKTESKTVSTKNLGFKVKNLNIPFFKANNNGSTTEIEHCKKEPIIDFKKRDKDSEKNIRKFLDKASAKRQLNFEIPTPNHRNEDNNGVLKSSLEKPLNYHLPSLLLNEKCSKESKEKIDKSTSNQCKYNCASLNAEDKKVMIPPSYEKVVNIEPLQSNKTKVKELVELKSKIPSLLLNGKFSKGSEEKIKRNISNQYNCTSLKAEDRKVLTPSSYEKVVNKEQLQSDGTEVKELVQFKSRKITEDLLSSQAKYMEKNPSKEDQRTLPNIKEVKQPKPRKIALDNWINCSIANNKTKGQHSMTIINKALKIRAALKIPQKNKNIFAFKKKITVNNKQEKEMNSPMPRLKEVLKPNKSNKIVCTVKKPDKPSFTPLPKVEKVLKTQNSKNNTNTSLSNSERDKQTNLLGKESIYAKTKIRKNTLTVQDSSKNTLTVQDSSNFSNFIKPKTNNSHVVADKLDNLAEVCVEKKQVTAKILPKPQN